MREFAHKGGLALPLSANQRQDRVELDAGLERTADGRRECLACDRTIELRVLRPEVVDKDRVQTRDAVPCQPQQVILEWIEGMAGRDLAECILDRAFAANAVNFLEVVPQRRVVAIHPRRRPLARPPRQIAQHDNPMREVVDRSGAFQPWVVLENELDVLRGTLVTAHLCYVHLREPVVILLVVRLRFEVLSYLLKPLLTDRDPNAVIGRRELLHRLVARQTPGRCVRCGVLVANAKLVNAYKVKRVDELPAARIRRMMAKKELAVIVDHGSRRRRSRRVGVTVICRALLIYSRQERVHRLGDAVRTAERSDNAFLVQRILLFLGGPANLGMHA